MSSLICYGDDSVGFTCAIEIGINCHTTCAICLIKAGFIGDGGVVGYPLFDHAGFDTSNPRSCVCGVGPSEFDLIACNEFRLLGGVLFFSDEGGYSLDSFFEFVLFSGYSATDIHELAFNISFDTAIKTNKYKNDVAWRNSSFDFCTKSEIFNASCGVLGFYTGGYDFAVSEYYFPVYRGACNDSFTLPTEVQEKLKSSPPAKFTEIYLECRNGFFEVINISIGLAMGNLAMYIPAAVFLATCLMALYSRIFHVTMAKTYTAQERDDILQFLAFNLLLARDGHYKFNPGPDGHSIKGQGNFELSSNSIVTALKDELAVKAYISRFISVAPDNPTSNHEKKSEMGVELAEIGGGVESAAKMTDTYELNERLKSSDYIENPLAKK